MKIISLVPSLTETLFDLGCHDQIIGRTKFCIHPNERISGIAKYGGTKNPHVSKIIAIEPDLVIANKEENRKEDITQIMQAGINVLVTDVTDYKSSLETLIEIGNRTNSLEQAYHIRKRIEQNFLSLHKMQPLKRAAYLIWKDPFMTIGNDTFIHDMMLKCGFQNVFGNQTRYPSTTLNELKNMDIEIILLSSEPYPFTKSHCQDIEQQTGIRTILVDGEYFSWYGSRMLGAPKYFKTIIDIVL